MWWWSCDGRGRSVFTLSQHSAYSCSIKLSIALSLYHWLRTSTQIGPDTCVINLGRKYRSRQSSCCKIMGMLKNKLGIYTTSLDVQSSTYPHEWWCMATPGSIISRPRSAFPRIPKYFTTDLSLTHLISLGSHPTDTKTSHLTPIVHNENIHLRFYPSTWRICTFPFLVFPCLYPCPCVCVYVLAHFWSDRSPLHSMPYAYQPVYGRSVITLISCIQFTWK